MPQPGDTQTLILRATKGDQTAVEDLLVANLPRLRAYMRLKVGDLVHARESTSDLVQSVCREVLEDLPGFEYRGEAAFRHWLFKRAAHKIVDKARHHRAEARTPTREQRPAPHGTWSGESGESGEPAYLASFLTPSRDAMAKEQLQRLERAFVELPEDYRDVILLHNVVGLTHDEIATELQRSVGAVRNLLYRGLARLSTLMREEPPEVSG
ncbi:MAG: RNA polymerase sigma factor [Planctomycetota bacterium]|jgi:RNA polymerase sigma-70 factor (ECF subfamily)